MRLTKVHKVGIASVFGVLVVAIGYASVRAKKRDKRYTLFLQAISNAIADIGGGLDSTKAFDLQYKARVLQSVSQTVITLKKQTAIGYAYQINSALTPWYLNDDEEKIYGVFRSLKDKVQVSQLASAYQEEYGNNLIDVLKDRLSTSEIKIVMGIVAKLPPYRTL
ncbi:hypothetical protein GCM10011344_41260 [Dokdonia pacifica]|uniref:Annexin n=1 Tax=Dokdonia pacifica TaxID=1627892 RepID=A0A239AC13_9FLAO|nr:hypothetical protein [Dokdonia pacifica]GGG36115.1 hypothetical protein GCM10011344_41260 [Dokdonia pacifica]SNR93089.1 hypothetical protein SAMN06265376_104312 [Dokdonia pacifica]